MNAFKYLLDNKIVEDKKEFQDLYSVRAIKIDGKPLSDPDMKITGLEEISIGCRIIEN